MIKVPCPISNFDLQTKTKIIFFDGVDCTGKSTLIQNIHEKTEFKHILIDRGPFTNMVYGSHKRHSFYKSYIDLVNELDLVDEVFFVYTTATPSVIMKRMKERNETDITPDDILPLMNLYDYYYKSTNIVPLIVETTATKPDKAAQRVIISLGL